MIVCSSVLLSTPRYECRSLSWFVSGNTMLVPPILSMVLDFPVSGRRMGPASAPQLRELALQRANRRKEDVYEKQQDPRPSGGGCPHRCRVQRRRGQDRATAAQEVVAKVKEAASTLSKTDDVAQFNQKQGPWVWKDTYIFVEDCSKKVIAAHPIMPETVGQDIMSLKDTKGKNVFQEGWCDAAKKPSGVWIEYWWPKPGEKQGSRKISYTLSAKGTPYVVGAGIYDDNATIAELSKQKTSTK